MFFFRVILLVADLYPDQRIEIFKECQQKIIICLSFLPNQTVAAHGDMVRRSDGATYVSQLKCFTTSIISAALSPPLQ